MESRAVCLNCSAFCVHISTKENRHRKCSEAGYILQILVSEDVSIFQQRPGLILRAEDQGRAVGQGVAICPGTALVCANYFRPLDCNGGVIPRQSAYPAQT